MASTSRAFLTALTLSPCRTEAREQLRRQVGTLRFDLQTLATTKTVKEEKKKALELRKAFIQKVSPSLRRSSLKGSRDPGCPSLSCSCFPTIIYRCSSG